MAIHNEHKNVVYLSFENQMQCLILGRGNICVIGHNNKNMVIDIIFQSGDFYGEPSNIMDFIFQLISECVGAFIGAGFAVLLFYKQNRRDKVKEETNIKNKAEDDMNYISFLVEDVVSDQEKQNQKLVAFFTTSSLKTTSQIKQLESIPMQNIIRLQRFLDEPDTYNSFMLVFGRKNKDNINKFKNITNSIDYLIKGNEQLYMLIEQGMPNDYARRMKYNELSDRVIGEIRIIAAEYDPPAKEVLELLRDYLEIDKPKEIEDHISIIVNPLINEIDKLHPSYTKLKELRDGLRALVRLKDEIGHQNKVVLDKFEGGIKDIKEVTDKLKTDSELIRSYKP